MEYTAENLAPVSRNGRNLAEIRGAEEVFLPRPLVAARYHRNGITISRWRKDPSMCFPKPHYFGRFPYWKLSELVSWERERVVAA